MLRRRGAAGRSGGRDATADVDRPEEAEIERRLAAVDTPRWEALRRAVDALRADPAPSSWVPERDAPPGDVDGAARHGAVPVHPELAASTSEALRVAGELDLMVPFDWSSWSRPRMPLTPEVVGAGSRTDAVRWFVALLRAERFSEGTLALAASDGTLVAVLERLLPPRP